MALRRLRRAEWREYCERISKSLENESAELEVVSLKLGDHVVARWLPLYGVVFDPRADVFEIALEGVDHSILHPTDVCVEETPRGLVAFEIATGDDAEQILKLRNPLSLPPGAASASEE